MSNAIATGALLRGRSRAVRGRAGTAVTATSRVTCPTAALGLTGDPVTGTITADGQGVSFTCETETSGRKMTMTSATALRPPAGDPMVAPRG